MSGLLGDIIRSSIGGMEKTETGMMPQYGNMDTMQKGGHIASMIIDPNYRGQYLAQLNDLKKQSANTTAQQGTKAQPTAPQDIKTKSLKDFLMMMGG